MNSKVLLLLALVAAVNADRLRHGYEDSYGGSSEEGHYEFSYKVKDYYGNNFGHGQKQDGEVTQGLYYTLLPDERVQTVRFTVDGDAGYVAHVSYKGEAKYDSGSHESYKPSSEDDPPEFYRPSSEEDFRDFYRSSNGDNSPAFYRPPYNSDSRETYRPPYSDHSRETYRPPYNSDSRETYRLPYNDHSLETYRPPYNDHSRETYKPNDDSYEFYRPIYEDDSRELYRTRFRF